MQKRNRRLLGTTIIAVAVVLGVSVADAAKKPKCPEGFSATNKGACYVVDGVKPMYGHPVVSGRVQFPRSYQFVILSATLLKEKKVKARCSITVADIEKDTETPWQAICVENSEIPHDTITVRIDSAM